MNCRNVPAQMRTQLALIREAHEETNYHHYHQDGQHHVRNHRQIPPCLAPSSERERRQSDVQAHKYWHDCFLVWAFMKEYERCKRRHTRAHHAAFTNIRAGRPLISFTVSALMSTLEAHSIPDCVSCG